MSFLFCLALKTLYSLTFYSHLYFSFLRSTPHPGQVNLSVLRSQCRACSDSCSSLFILCLPCFSPFCLSQFCPSLQAYFKSQLFQYVWLLQIILTFSFKNSKCIWYWNGQLIVSKDFNGFKLGKMTDY